MALSAKQKILIKELLKNFFIVSRACTKVGIDRSTYYEWLTQPDFKDEIDRVEKDLLILMEDELKNAGLNQEQWAVKFYLERKHPAYKLKVEAEIEDKRIKLDV